MSVSLVKSPFQLGTALPWRAGMAPRYLCRIPGVTMDATITLADVATIVERGTPVRILARWDV